MIGKDRMIPQLCVSPTERAAGDVIGNDIPPCENTQQFESFSGSNQVFTQRNGTEVRENMCVVPLVVADHADVVGPQFGDVFGCQIEMNDGQYNEQYNEMYNDMYNKLSTEPNIGPNHKVNNEAFEGTHLKGIFEGTMFVATALDGNEQVYPITFGYVDSENNISWEWFLDCLKGALGKINYLVFISDRHASIEAEISKVFPYATYTICC
ncbi:hypothetical protein Ddye_032250 [Dipteronia dyeriana]|uniref:MULE transposase domain-containing protein n=1 Tax=Dipteronia dyeriana TaxID=168575 RepID=A0AAD9WPC3_9ROSI|nr:hypothetical protein Ddye_032250 [Dipteronia dyeriana]